jgi:cytosine/creatinine deaminase
MPPENHEHYMTQAYAQALKSYAEGGNPIGAVLIDNKTNSILGQGHNCLVQESNPILHGEMSALRAAGRMPNRHNTTLYTTLQPCFMCTGAIIQFGIPRVVIADTANASSNETIQFMKTRGVEVIVLDPTKSQAAQACIELTTKFRKENPTQWQEDWGGGPNPALKP